MWTLLLACQATTPTSPTTPPTPTETTPEDTDTTIPTTPTTPEDTGTAPPVPMIDEVMRKICPEAGAGEPLPVGADLKVVTLPGAGRCNDGSPPKLYVRAATDPKHLNDWVWFFDGGNNCGTYAACAIRWCNLNPPFGRRHMSSDPYPDTVGGEGVFSSLVENDFKGWNHVFAGYCSSDSWSGTNSDYVFDDPEKKQPSYRVHFEGAQISEDGIDAGLAGLVSDDGKEVMPALGDAVNIISACVSSGCQGAINNTDLFENKVPTATVTTMVDSSFFAAPEILDAVYWDAMDYTVSRMWVDMAKPVWGAAADPDCAADHPTDEWRCMDMDVMIRNYLNRVVHHVDQGDPIVYGFYGAVGMTKEQFAVAVEGTMRLYEDTEPQVSIHANNCGIHAALDADGTFMNYTVVDAISGGEPMGLHDVLLSSINGTRAVAIDSVPPTTSVCGLK